MCLNYPFQFIKIIKSNRKECWYTCSSINLFHFLRSTFISLSINPKTVINIFRKRETLSSILCIDNYVDVLLYRVSTLTLMIACWYIILRMMLFGCCLLSLLIVSYAVIYTSYMLHFRNKLWLKFIFILKNRENGFANVEIVYMCAVARERKRWKFPWNEEIARKIWKRKRTFSAW